MLFKTLAAAQRAQDALRLELAAHSLAREAGGDALAAQIEELLAAIECALGG